MLRIISLILLVTTAYGQQRCGNSNSLRIVGGTEAGRLQYPWQTLMFVDYKTDKPGMYMSSKCGASIISDQWVVTAAHCFGEPEGSKGLAGVRLVVGEHNTDEANNKYRVNLRATSVSVHGGYNTDTMNNDIAMVKFNQKLDFNGVHKYLQPICLPQPNLQVKGDECMASGWGRTTDGGSDSHILRHVKLPMIDDATCTSVWRNLMSPYKFCAGVMAGGKDSCQGDSGGPLQCPLSNNVYVLKGITSFGGKCAEENRPGVYTKVELYLDWIKKVMAEN